MMIPSAEARNDIKANSLLPLSPSRCHIAPSALPKVYVFPHPGRCPGLLHFAPLALVSGVMHNADAVSPQVLAEKRGNLPGINCFPRH
jgi:hypothetical protein